MQLDTPLRPATEQQAESWQQHNADAWPEFRLANLIYQRRARWLLSRRDQLFLIPDEKPKP